MDEPEAKRLIAAVDGARREAANREKWVSEDEKKSLWRDLVDSIYDKLRDNRAVGPSVRQTIWHDLSKLRVDPARTGGSVRQPYVPDRLRRERAAAPPEPNQRNRCLTAAEMASREWFPRRDDDLTLA